MTDDRISFWDLNLCEISLDNECYKISNAPKRGANCLVYEALKLETVDSKKLEHKIILKEFFPLFALSQRLLVQKVFFDNF
jgi:hypothetical protein